MRNFIATTLFGMICILIATSAQAAPANFATNLAAAPPFGQEIKMRVAESQANNAVAQYRAKGYVPIFIDAFNHRIQNAVNSGPLKTYFNFIFEKRIVSDYGVTIGAPFIAYDSNEERVIFLESYLSESGNIRFNIITRKNTLVPFKTFHVKANQFQWIFDHWAGLGYHISTRTSVRRNGQSYITALFEKSYVGGWVSKPHLTQTQATAAMIQYRNKGYYLRFMDIAHHTNKYSLIFHQKPPGVWFAQNGFTKSQALNKISQANTNGYRTTVLCGYDQPGLSNGNEVNYIKYAVTFRKKLTSRSVSKTIN